MNMSPRTFWFLMGLGALVLASFYAPQLAGGIVILLVLYLGFTLARKGEL